MSGRRNRAPASRSRCPLAIMSEIRAVFEPGNWKDFSKQHKELRLLLEDALITCAGGGCPDPLAVWGAYGAGKTQFLFWVAEKASEQGFVPIYFHLNDLIDGLPESLSPDDFRKHAGVFVSEAIKDLHKEEVSGKLLELYRDKALLAFIRQRLAKNGREEKPILLVDEVEQAYLSLTQRVRADDRSPLRAWLEEDTFKVFALAVGSLYVLGRADRERLTVQPIPPVHPKEARELFPDLPVGAVNCMWWLSRGKPRHFMKAVKKYQRMKPVGASDVHDFVSGLDSVSQAPYEGESQSVVPASRIVSME